MKKTKKLFISLAAALMATTLVAPAVAKTNQVHAEEVTSPSPNTDQGKLTLNHKTRIYNKKGQKRYSYRGGNGLLKKAATVKYVGKVEAITDPDAKRYSFRDDDWNWFYLPYKTIKGKEYYNIGHGGYIKAINVSKINGSYLYTNEVTFKAIEKYPIIQVVDGKAKSTGKVISKGQKVTLNGRTSGYALFGTHADGDGDSSDYMIKGSNNEFISLDNGIIRQILLPYSNFMNVQLTADAYLYTEKGEKFIHHISSNEVILGDKTNGKADFTPQNKKGTLVQVYKAIYLWAIDDQRPELFYQLDDYQFPEDKTTLFIKAANTKYLYGPQLKPANTEQDVTK